MRPEIQSLHPHCTPQQVMRIIADRWRKEKAVFLKNQFIGKKGRDVDDRNASNKTRSGSPERHPNHRNGPINIESDECDLDSVMENYFPRLSISATNESNQHTILTPNNARLFKAVPQDVSSIQTVSRKLTFD